MSWSSSWPFAFFFLPPFPRLRFVAFLGPRLASRPWSLRSPSCLALVDRSFTAGSCAWPFVSVLAWLSFAPRERDKVLRSCLTTTTRMRARSLTTEPWLIPKSVSSSLHKEADESAVPGAALVVVATRVAQRLGLPMGSWSGTALVAARRKTVGSTPFRAARSMAGRMQCREPAVAVVRPHTSLVGRATTAGISCITQRLTRQRAVVVR